MASFFLCFFLYLSLCLSPVKTLLPFHTISLPRTPPLPLPTCIAVYLCHCVPPSCTTLAILPKFIRRTCLNHRNLFSSNYFFCWLNIQVGSYCAVTNPALSGLPLSLPQILHLCCLWVERKCRPIDRQLRTLWFFSVSDPKHPTCGTLLYLILLIHTSILT